MAKLLSGSALSRTLREDLQQKVSRLRDEGRRQPCLVVIQVGKDPASSIYVGYKQKACAAIGIKSELFSLDEDIKQEELLALIERLNNDPAVDGILCQLPLPGGIDESLVLESVKPDKDVDGFHPVNVGLLHMGKDCPAPCTAEGIVEILRHYQIPLEGANVLVAGRSQIVGKPVAALLTRENATVTLAHSRTKDLKNLTRRADIVIAAIGKHHFFDASYFNSRSVVIDVGIHRIDGRVEGDVNFADVEATVAAITPVPGGVGPMTITMLMKNTLSAYAKHENIEF